MLLGVIPMIYFEFLEKNSKSENWKNLGKIGSYAVAWDALPRRGRGAKMAPLGYTTE